MRATCFMAGSQITALYGIIQRVSDMWYLQLIMPRVELGAAGSSEILIKILFIPSDNELLLLVVIN